MDGVRRLTAVVVLAVASACGGADDEAGPTQEELVDALIDGGLEPVDARCWVGEVYDDLSLEDRQAIQRADDSYEDFDDPSAIRAASEACDN